MSYKYRPKRGLPLSPKQDAIMLAIAEGKRNKQICGTMNMAESTLQTHLQRIMLKLGAKTPEQAAIFYDRARPKLEAVAPEIEPIFQDLICYK